MRILVLSFQDPAAGCGKLARAINEHPDHEARAARWRKGRLDYDVGFPVIWQPNAKRTINLIGWSQAVIVTGPWWGLLKNLPWGTNCLFPPGSPKRKVVVNYRGTPYRQRKADYNKADRSRGVVQSGNFIDLLLYGNFKHWLPVPIWEHELTQYRRPHKGNHKLVVQAVTKKARFHKKNTPGVKKQLGNIPGVKLDIVFGVTNRECLLRLGKADIVVTAFKNGYGNAGLEAMAMGIPVIANGFPALVAKYEEIIGYLPFVQSPVKNLRQTVLNLDDEARKDIVGKQLCYLRRFHHPRVVANKAVELCQNAKMIKQY